MATKTAERTDNIIIENIGPIEHAVIPAPPGKIVVLCGDQGCGKSTALETVKKLIGEPANLSKRDGAKIGSAEGFDVRISVNKLASRKGEASIGRLEGMDISLLVDPPVKKTEAREARRIQELLGIAGATATVEAFYSLAGGKSEFEAIVPPGSIKTDDPVELASQITRAFQSRAREIESRATETIAEEKVLRESITSDGIAYRAEAELQADLEAAIEKRSALRNQALQAAEDAAFHKDATAELERVRGEYDGPSVEAATVAVGAAQSEHEMQHEIVHGLRQQLRVAEEKMERLASHWHDKRHELELAELHDKHVATLQSQVEMACTAGVTDAEMAAAETAVKTAQDEVQKAREAAKDAERRDRAEVLKTAAKRLTAQADRIRAAASKTDDVLSDLVATLGTDLHVYEGRLCIPSDRGPHEPFEELSEGEKYVSVIRVAIESLRKRGKSAMVLDQRAWGELSPRTRSLIAEQIAGTEMTLYTALATSDRLHAEVFEGAA